MNNLTGIVLCECGPNIGDAVDLDRLAAELSKLPGIAWVEQHDLPCSKDGAAKVIALLRERPVERLVVAGCSPKDREKVFQGCLEQAGVNPYMLQFANIREHCAWTGIDRDAATDKAFRLVHAAFDRVQLHEPLDRRSVPMNPDVLVIGAGVAGMETAVLLAREGRTVHLVESTPSIGGLVCRLSELYPKMECSSCALEPLMDEVLHHKNVRVHLQSRVVSVRGFSGNFHVDIATDARGVDPAACMGCGMCMEACPVEALDAADFGNTKRKAIHNTYTGALPNAPVVDRSSCLSARGESCDACVKSCPFGAIDLARPGEELAVQVGAIVIAAGAEVKAMNADQKRIMSAIQFERMLNPNGWTGGRIVSSSGTPPASAIVISLADERTTDQLAVMNAMKYTTMITEQLPETTVDLFIGELAAPSAREREHRSHIEASARVRIHRVRSLDSLRIDPTAGSVSCDGETAQADIVVLSDPIHGPGQIRELAESLGVETDGNGFLKAWSSLLDPVASRVAGVFITGTAAGPATTPQAVLQAAATAGRVLSLLARDSELELNPCTSIVDENRCSSCGTCVSVCPYHAIERRDGGTPRVEEVLCHGCGVCSSACPSGAMQTRHFKLSQIMAEVGALCGDGGTE